MKKKPIISIVILVVLAMLYFVCYQSPSALAKTGCEPQDQFNLYEFNAEVVNKFYNNGTNVLTLITFESEPTTLDLTLEKNGLFDHLVIGDTLKKKTNSMSIYITNFNRDENFECDFSCDGETKQ